MKHSFSPRSAAWCATVLLGLTGTAGRARADAWPLRFTVQQTDTSVSAPAAGDLGQQEIDTEARKISESLMSPFCPGRTIAACPSYQAQELQDSIRDWLAGGASRATVANRLVERYGDAVRAAPPFRGFGLVAWLLPAVLIVGFGIGLSFFLRARTAAAQAGSASNTPELDDEQAARLSKALSDLDALR